MATARIASIHFAPVTCEGELVQFGFGKFEMPAVASGAEPFILTVKDRVQKDRGGYEGGPVRKLYTFAHSGEEIARSLVKKWTTSGLGMTPQCRPGIWVVRDRLPVVNADGTSAIDADGFAEWRDATREEMKQMWDEDLRDATAADLNYGQSRHLAATVMAEKPAMIPFIQARDRLASRRYYPDAAYLKSDALAATKICQYCTKTIGRAAIKCPECREVVDVMAYAEKQAMQNAAVEAAQENLGLKNGKQPGKAA